MQEQVSPAPAQGSVKQVGQDVRQSRAKLLSSLHAEIEDLRQEILKKKSGRSDLRPKMFIINVLVRSFSPSSHEC